MKIFVNTRWPKLDSEYAEHYENMPIQIYKKIHL